MTAQVALVALMVPAALALSALAMRKGRPLQTLPSLFWTASAVAPFLYLQSFFPTKAAGEQALGLVVVTLALLASDAESLFLGKASTVAESKRPIVADRLTKIVMVFLATFVILIPILHLLALDRIPFLVRLFDPSATGQQLSLEREQFSKLLHVPQIAKLLPNWMQVVAAPTLMVMLAVTGRWLLALVTAVWCGFYAVASLAMFPIVLLAFITIVGLVGFQTVRRQRIFMSAILILSVAWIVAGIVRGETYAAWYASLDMNMIPAARLERLKAHDRPLTPGDIDRVQDPGTPLAVPGSFGSHIDSLLRRSVLIPMEVSNRWYAFFPEQAGRYRPLADLLPSRRIAEHPARQVAEWGYRRLFPERYTASTMAYASLDADANAFGGLGAVAIAALILAACRFLIAVLPSLDLLSRSASWCALGALTILPFQASIQAILISQGIALYLFLLGAWFVLRRLWPATLMQG